MGDEEPEEAERPHVARGAAQPKPSVDDGEYVPEEVSTLKAVPAPAPASAPAPAGGAGGQDEALRKQWEEYYRKCAEYQSYQEQMQAYYGQHHHPHHAQHHAQGHAQGHPTAAAEPRARKLGETQSQATPGYDASGAYGGRGQAGPTPGAGPYGGPHGGPPGGKGYPGYRVPYGGEGYSEPPHQHHHHHHHHHHHQQQQQQLHHHHHQHHQYQHQHHQYHHEHHQHQGYPPHAQHPAYGRPGATGGPPPYGAPGYDPYGKGGKGAGAMPMGGPQVPAPASAPYGGKGMPPPGAWGAPGKGAAAPPQPQPQFAPKPTAVVARPLNAPAGEPAALRPPADAEVCEQVKFWVARCLGLGKHASVEVKAKIKDIVRRHMPPKDQWAAVDWARREVPPEIEELMQPNRTRVDVPAESEDARAGERRRRRRSTSSSSSDRRHKKKKRKEKREAPAHEWANRAPPQRDSRERDVRDIRDIGSAYDRFDRERLEQNRYGRPPSSDWRPGLSPSKTSPAKAQARPGLLDDDYMPQPSAWGRFGAAPQAQRPQAGMGLLDRIPEQRTALEMTATDARPTKAGKQFEQLGKRANRLARFKEDKPAKQFFPVSQKTPAPVQLASENFEEVEKLLEVVTGQCEDIEKSYIRSAAGLQLDASSVRPQRVLEKSLKHILATKDSKVDQRVYCNEQFKSIRQDLTVQHIFNRFTTEVYETHARICLEHGDLGEFNACQAKLRAFHKRPEMVISEDNVIEFQAYRIMYTALTNSHADLAAEVLGLTKEDIRAHPPIRHAMSLVTALTPLNVYLLGRCYRSAPNMGRLLIDMFLAPPRGLRMQIYGQLLKACKPTIPLARLRGFLMFPDQDPPGVVDQQNPDPDTFPGFTAYVKTVMKTPTDIDSAKSTETFVEVQAFLDTRKDFNEHKEEGSASPSPSPPPPWAL